MSTSINGINGTDYAAALEQAKATNTENTLNSINKATATDDEMMAACKEFEKYMLEQIYKGMEKTVMRAEEKSDYEEYFGDMLVEEYAKMASEQGSFGLAEQLYESMKNTYGGPTIEAL